MTDKYEFKIVRGKANYGYNPQVRDIAEIIEKNKESVNCREIRILHCEKLVSVRGIEQCKMLVDVNLSSNSLENIDGMKALVNLQNLDLKANRIRSLKPIETLTHLKKIDASQNELKSL
jgi:Leucine-rich repeat (LRR) protein